MIPITGATQRYSANSSDDSNSSKTQKTDDLTNRDTFLKLLVAQLKNQNPLDPTDSVQFITQLAQFTQLEQTTQMEQDLTAIRQAVSPSSSDQANGSQGN